jgi:hypothetical protein
VSTGACTDLSIDDIPFAHLFNYLLDFPKINHLEILFSVFTVIKVESILGKK